MTSKYRTVAGANLAAALPQVQTPIVSQCISMLASTFSGGPAAGPVWWYHGAAGLSGALQACRAASCHLNAGSLTHAWAPLFARDAHHLSPGCVQASLPMGNPPRGSHGICLHCLSGGSSSQDSGDGRPHSHYGSCPHFHQLPTQEKVQPEPQTLEAVLSLQTVWQVQTFCKKVQDVACHSQSML